VSNESALRQAREALQEICGTLEDDDDFGAKQIARHAGRSAIAAIDAALTAQAAPSEPVAWLWELGKHRQLHFQGDNSELSDWKVSPLYTAPPPPAAPAQGLTDERIVEVLKGCDKEDPTQEGWIWRQRIKWARAIERELRASTAAAPSPVPAGWQLVPVEPTSTMLAALTQEWHSSRHGKFKERYAAMLAAAPGAPTPAPKGTE
jgi:hypothetical protein